MKQLIDFLPLLVFFALFKLYDVYIATGALIAATFLQLVITYVMTKKVEKMQVIMFGVVALFGSLTIFLHNDNFIKWKVTIVYLIFSLAIGVSHLMGKSLIKNMLGKELTLPDSVWGKISWAWVAFFLLCSAANIYVAFNLPLDVWVNFKVFGLLIATLIFTVLTGIYIYKHMDKSEEESNL
jgi:intracellular septation protein